MNANSHIYPPQVEAIGNDRFVADASELGWPPGHWPPKVETTLGNKQPLRRVELTDAGAVYKQDFGVVEVQVYND